jgi:hypothetical protein
VEIKRIIRRNIGILIIIVSIGIVYGVSSNRMDDTVKVEPAVYQELLAKYERALKDPTLPRDTEEPQTPDGLYYWIWRCIGRYPVCYCIKDLNGDGREELVLGAVWIDPPLELFGRVYDEIYHPFIIYTYEDADVEWNIIKEEYVMMLYEGGIVELISGGIRQHFMYYQVGEGGRHLDTIVEEQYREEEPRYYRCIDGEDGLTTEYADITEEEFHAIRNRYATNVERLDWKPLEGFWNP